MMIMHVRIRFAELTKRKFILMRMRVKRKVARKILLERMTFDDLDQTYNQTRYVKGERRNKNNTLLLFQQFAHVHESVAHD